MSFKAIIPTNINVKDDNGNTCNNLIFNCIKIIVKFSERFSELKVDSSHHKAFQFNENDKIKACFKDISIYFDINNKEYAIINLDCDFYEIERFSDVCNKLLDVLDCLNFRVKGEM